MATETVSVLVPPLRLEPRGSVLVGAVVDWALAVHAAWQIRSARAAEARRLRAAERAARRLARDRVALVELARRYEPSQPEFAKDLYAAAGMDREP